MTEGIDFTFLSGHAPSDRIKGFISSAVDPSWRAQQGLILLPGMREWKKDAWSQVQGKSLNHKNHQDHLQFLIFKKVSVPCATSRG